MLNRCSLKHGRQWNFLAQPLFYQCEQTNGRQGMSSQLKEIVRHADGSNTQNLFPQTSELEFQSISRRYERSSRLGSCSLGLRQSAAVYLPVGHQWQSVEQHEDRGHHVIGQLLFQKAAQLTSRRPGFPLERQRRPPTASLRARLPEPRRQLRARPGVGEALPRFPLVRYGTRGSSPVGQFDPEIRCSHRQGSGRGRRSCTVALPARR